MFYEIVRAAYLGESYRLGSMVFNLSPHIVRPFDFSRRTKSADEYGRLISNLNKRFRDAARSDMYRRSTGWIALGEREAKIRTVEINDELHVVPILSCDRVVAIDTSTIDHNMMLLGIFNIPDYQAAYEYLERHLTLPRTHNRKEFHWSKLNQENRQKVLENFRTLMQISCDSLITIRTDALISPLGKVENIFTNLIDGCFSGYETTEGKFRNVLRQHLYILTNKVPIHCDADFGTLKPLQVATIYVKRLGTGLQPDPMPTFVNLKSHESKPIQVADILIGAIRSRLQENTDQAPLNVLKFDKRKIKSQKGKTVSAYYWTRNKLASESRQARALSLLETS